MRRADKSKRATPDKPEDPALDPLNLNIATIAGMRARAEQQVDRHQRFAETVTAWLGRPRFLYLLITLVIGWILVNVYASRLGWRQLDPPPFNLLISVVNVAALLMATVVLITQNREGKMAARREHLDLQINLLTEQRTAKIIALLEELRRDLPAAPNRVDREAEALSAPVDPVVILSALEEQMTEALDGAAQRAESAPQAESEDQEIGGQKIT